MRRGGGGTLVELAWVGGRLAASLLLIGIGAGCTSVRYAGVDLRPGASSPELQALAKSASRGDGDALFELGRRFETGDSVAVDFSRAILLYRRAIQPVGGARMAYVPGVGPTRSSVSVIDAGTVRRGSIEAMSRLHAIWATCRYQGDSGNAALCKAYGPIW